MRVEHPHVAGEPLHPHRCPALINNQVEQVVGVLEAALGLGRARRPKLLGDRAQRAFEVGGQLASVSSARAAANTVAL